MRGRPSRHTPHPQLDFTPAIALATVTRATHLTRVATSASMRGTEVKEAFTFLDQISGPSVRSTKRSLRHTVLMLDRNRERWPTSTYWEAARPASFCGGAA